MIVPVEKIVSSQSLDLEIFDILNAWQIKNLKPWQVQNTE